MPRVECGGEWVKASTASASAIATRQPNPHAPPLAAPVRLINVRRRPQRQQVQQLAARQLRAARHQRLHQQPWLGCARADEDAVGTSRDGLHTGRAVMGIAPRPVKGAAVDSLPIPTWRTCKASSADTVLRCTCCRRRSLSGAELSVAANEGAVRKPRHGCRCTSWLLPAAAAAPPPPLPPLASAKQLKLALMEPSHEHAVAVHPGCANAWPSRAIRSVIPTEWAAAPGALRQGGNRSSPLRSPACKLVS